MTISKPVVVIFSCFILAVAFSSVLIWPKYRDLQTVELQIKAKKAEYEAREKYFSELYSVSEKLKGYEAELAKIDSALPKDPSMPSLLNFLQGATAQAGLTLDTMTPAGISPGSETGLKTITLSMQVSGSYSSFKDFLLILERSSRLLNVESISFASPQSADKPFSFSLTLKTNSY